MKKKNSVIKLTEDDFHHIVKNVVKALVTEDFDYSKPNIDGTYVVWYDGIDDMADVSIDTKNCVVSVNGNEMDGERGRQAIEWIEAQKLYSKCGTEEAIESWLREISR